MLAYAAHRRTRRQLSPTALGLIIGAHAFALVVLATTKMDVITIGPKPPTEIYDVDIPKPPEPVPPPADQPVIPKTAPSKIDVLKPIINPPNAGPVIEFGPTVIATVPDIGPVMDQPILPPLHADPPKAPVRVAARPTTPADLLRPPYPDSKRRSEEEAVLRLRLSIDQRGRVTAVDPVGAADPAFLAAARGHLVRHWRYRPATEDGRPVATSLTITLRFELEDE